MHKKPTTHPPAPQRTGSIFEQAQKRLEKEAYAALDELVDRLKRELPKQTKSSVLFSVPDIFYDLYKQDPDFRDRVNGALDEELGIPALNCQILAVGDEHYLLIYFFRRVEM